MILDNKKNSLIKEGFNIRNKKIFGEIDFTLIMIKETKICIKRIFNRKDKIIGKIIVENMTKKSNENREISIEINIENKEIRDIKETIIENKETQEVKEIREMKEIKEVREMTDSIITSLNKLIEDNNINLKIEIKEYMTDNLMIIINKKKSKESI